MKTKNIVQIFLLLLSLSITSTSHGATLSVDMISGGSLENSLSSNTGSSISIDIILNNTLDLSGFEFDLEFDNSIMSATSIVSGDIFGLDTFSLENQINSNSIGFSETTLAFVGLDVLLPTILATISFDVIDIGAGVLNLENVILSDSFGLEIGSVSLNSANLIAESTSSVPEPSIFWLFSAGLLGVLSVRTKTS
ncbi:MAG: hypothetical protein GQ532_14180 [Methylomarinum sp.]|nr:hypothetical protein [Methylomarinum sp.]